MSAPSSAEIEAARERLVEQLIAAAMDLQHAKDMEPHYENQCRQQVCDAKAAVLKLLGDGDDSARQWFVAGALWFASTEGYDPLSRTIRARALAEYAARTAPGGASND